VAQARDRPPARVDVATRSRSRWGSSNRTGAPWTARPRTPATIPGSSAAAPLAGAPTTVLVVDDDSDLLTTTEMLLADAGYEVMLADSGNGAPSRSAG
jgi:PleD family two-component response regulator